MYRHHKNVGGKTLRKENDPKATRNVVNINHINYTYNVQKCKREMV